MDVSTAWNNIYSAIYAGVTDPEARSKKWIYSSFPDVYAKDFNGFPLIIIGPVSLKENIITLKNDTKRREWQCVVEVYSKSASVADTVVDLIRTSLISVSSLHILKVDNISSSSLAFGGKRLHLRAIKARWFSYD